MRSYRLPTALHVFNEGTAFLLEMVMLVVLGWWGAKTGSTTAIAVLLGAGAPAAAGIVWGLFAAPKAKVRLPLAGILAVKALAFGSATVALYALGRQGEAEVFAAVTFVNTALAAYDRNAALTARTARTARTEGTPRP